LTGQGETEQQADRIRVDPGALRDAKPRQMLVRFAARVAASLAAAVISSRRPPVVA